LHDAADDAAIIHPFDTPDICRQKRFNPLPLFIAQPKQVSAHDPSSSSKNESGSYRQSGKINEF
jgi:hypothetical protein